MKAKWGSFLQKCLKHMTHYNSWDIRKSWNLHKLDENWCVTARMILVSVHDSSSHDNCCSLAFMACPLATWCGTTSGIWFTYILISFLFCFYLLHFSSFISCGLFFFFFFFVASLLFPSRFPTSFFDFCSFCKVSRLG